MKPPGMWRRLREWGKSWSRRARSATLLAPAGANDLPSSADDALAPGTELKEFVIERVLGVGGFGVTYLARDVSLDAWRAVKEYLPRECGVRRIDGVVGPRLETDTEEFRWGLAGFLKEARVLARFDHRYIVRVYRVFEALGTAYLVMEYVEGRSLKSEIHAAGMMEDDEVRAILLAITESLAAVHDSGLLHRDIKPDNVMLRPDGTPVLIDFGAARQMLGLSRSSVAVVSDGYAPIEQYGEQQERQGPWTDIYALGAVAYFALSGRVPPKAPDRLRTDRLPPVADAASRPVDPGLVAAVDSALAVHEADRPQSVVQWRTMLDRAAEPVPFPPEDDGAPRDTRLDDEPHMTWIVGRGHECDVRVNDTSVSRSHADLMPLSGGRLRVTDRESTNGTFVRDGGAWRAVHQELLAPTDRVRFGDYEITVSQLNALCVERGRASSGYKSPDLGAGSFTGLVRAPDTQEFLDSRKGLARDPVTGEILEKEPPTE